MNLSMLAMTLVVLAMSPVVLFGFVLIEIIFP